MKKSRYKDINIDSALKLIGNRIYTYRMSQNKKMEVLAGEIGISKSTLSRIEHGEYEGLSYRLIVSIAGCLQIDVSELTITI